MTPWKKATFSDYQTAKCIGPSRRWMCPIIYLRAITSNNEVQPVWICREPEIIYQVTTLWKPVHHSNSRNLWRTNTTVSMALRNKETAFLLFLSPDVLWGAACYTKQKEMRKSVTTYPCQWVNIDFGVKQLVIIIILQIPLLHNTVYIGSIANKSCNNMHRQVIPIKSTTLSMLSTS